MGQGRNAQGRKPGGDRIPAGGAGKPARAAPPEPDRPAETGGGDPRPEGSAAFSPGDRGDGFSGCLRENGRGGNEPVSRNGEYIQRDLRTGGKTGRAAVVPGQQLLLPVYSGPAGIRKLAGGRAGHLEPDARNRNEKSPRTAGNPASGAGMDGCAGGPGINRNRDSVIRGLDGEELQGAAQGRQF